MIWLAYEKNITRLTPSLFLPLLKGFFKNQKDRKVKETTFWLKRKKHLKEKEQNRTTKTKRKLSYIKKLLKEQPILFSQYKKKIKWINHATRTDFLVWLVKQIVKSKKDEDQNLIKTYMSEITSVELDAKIGAT